MPHETKDVLHRLRKEGWIEHKGKGDHKNFKKLGSREIITVPTGTKEIKEGTYKNIARIAGWND